MSPRLRKTIAVLALAAAVGIAFFWVTRYVREIRPGAQDSDHTDDADGIQPAAPSAPPSFAAPMPDASAIPPVTAPSVAPGEHEASLPAPPSGAPSEEFAALAARVLSELPTQGDLRELSEEELHDTPRPVVRAGQLLGQIAEAVQAQPGLRAQAFEFYAKCTLDQELLTPVRGLCYSHIIDDPKAPAPSTLPEEVVRLARLVPPEPARR